MSKRKIASVAFTGAAAAAATAMAAPAAFAASAFTIHTTSVNGPIVAAGTSIGGAATGVTTLTDNKTGTVLSCSGATFTGKTTVASGTTSAEIATTKVIFGTTATPCHLKGHTSITFTASASANLWASHISSPTGAKGHIKSITHAAIKGLCSATISQPAGSTHWLAASYNNTSQTLTVPGTAKALKIATTGGLCVGLINAGDSASFKGAFAVSKPPNGLYIK